jgi:hypothetical protein
LGRRTAVPFLAAAIAFTSVAAWTPAAAQTGAPTAANPSSLAERKHDWDWLVGRWTVRHHRLKARLAGSHEWQDFNGSSSVWLTLDGLGTVDDNVIELPGDSYRAVGIRAFDPKTNQWSIWWLDGRTPETIFPPVHGGFKNGEGEFIGDDSFNGRPIKVRFRWTNITATSAHWEQAFSPDGGKTWETNWTMEFTRVKT